MSYGVYIRISQEGDRTPAEVEEQLDIYEAAVRQYAKRSDLTISEDDVVRESDVSGTKAVKERGLERLILRVESGDLEGVVAPNLERFARDVIEGCTAEKRLTDAGGVLRTVEDGYASNAPGSQLNFVIRMGVAEDYARRAGEGLRSRKRRFIEDGGWPYAMPLGYKASKEGKRPVVVAPEAKIVRELFRRRANGEQVASLADELDLPVTQARSILKSRFYLGEVKLEVKKGVSETLKNHHAPILASEGAWQAAQMKGEYHARDGSIAAGCNLSALVHCGTCGARCRACKTGRKGAVSYVCTEKGCPEHCGASAHLLDPYVEHALETAVLAQHPAIGAIIEGSTAYMDALAAVEAAQATHDEYRDDVEAQTALGMKSFVQGLTVRADRVVAAREALTEARKSARPEWWEGNTKKVTYEEFLAEDDRRSFERFIDRIVIGPSGRGTGALRPLAERVDVYFIGDDEAYVVPQKAAA